MTLIPDLQHLTWMADAAPKFIIVMLHGRGMRPEDFEPFSRALGVPAVFCFPRGPEALPDETRSWWPPHPATSDSPRPRDLFDTHPPHRPALRGRLAELASGLRERHPGLPLVLIGFSQGGMLACDFALHYPSSVDALVLLASTRIAADEWAPLWPALRDLPTLICHGRADEEIAFSAGERLRDALVQASARVEWVPFDGGHQTPLLVWRSIRRFVLGLESPRAGASP